MEDVNKLIAQANKSYALKSYEDAADLYARATESLRNLNGEESPKNGDALFLYGRTLLKLAIQRSDVLGGSSNKVGEDEPHSTDEVRPKGEPSNDPRFSFQGDEDEDGYEDVEEDDLDAEQTTNGEAATAEDDLQSAWEILDVARVALQKQLGSTTDFTDKTAVRNKLADTYDALGEIALENENFDQAVEDLKTTLELKKSIYGEASPVRSAAHYMLALALEYCTSKDSRNAAISELEASIKCLELRLETADPNSRETAEERGMLEDVQAKLAELQAPVESGTKVDMADIFGQEGNALKESIVQAMQSSNDLSGLVRKKEKKRNQSPSREGGDEISGSAAKKAKIEPGDSAR